MPRQAKAKLLIHRTAWCVVRFAIAILLPFAGASASLAAEDAEQIDYLTKVKPLLRARCYACHGALRQQAKLRLDTGAAMLQGGESGPAIVAGDAGKSRLLKRVSASDPADRMPPEHDGEPLAPDQIAVLRTWISAGAKHPQEESVEADPREHWAFRPIQRPPVPTTKDHQWARNPIDAFIAQQHQRHGLAPRPEASPAMLLRRLSFDLTGLPPTSQEIRAFALDHSPEAYERTVERFLDSPQHGQRWARHWMDIWRYSDWWGLGNELRNSQKHIWHWRDWIVESLNADLPYDQMVRLMLAADELAPQDLQKLRATGFLARNYFVFNRHQWMDETVEHISKGFLGLSINCAKCHDHKYDPVSQLDYYRLRAIFEPYHVRLDAVPGEADLTRDGIPRAFDGVLDAPTWRLVRGQEANPDKSVKLEPGLPSVFSSIPFSVQPIELPLAAWQPERRPWVAEANLQAARNKIAAAQSKLHSARAKTDPPPVDAGAEVQIAELSLAAANAELHSVECRTAALRAIDADPDHRLARAAVRAEREASAAHARVSLAEAERNLQSAKSDQRDAKAKEVTAARERLDKALKQIDEPSDQFTHFTGAQWTPTRFLTSTADDPRVAFPPRSSGRRRALAEWITDRRNPLFARVAVNHLWLRHFGAPLVPTVFDFGRNGKPPTHPELLDWLASEFIDSGWDMKHMHRLMVTSAAYRLSSSTTGAGDSLAKDPDNLYLWRRSPARLESEAIRDALFALADSLDETFGGPPVVAPQQSESRRRSLYFYHSNNDRNLILTTFDEALVTECYRRDQSIVPQQSLAMTNSRLVLDLSRPIARRLENDLVASSSSSVDDDAFIRGAFLALHAIEPTPAEIAASRRALDTWRKLQEAGKDAAAFARSHLVWVLLNHNDFITIR